MDFPTKRCTRCKQELPATSDYFSRNKRQKDGLYYYCRPCAAEIKRNPERQKDYERAQRNKILIPQGNRECSICSEVKPLTEYYKSKSATGYHSGCKQCYAESMGWEYQPRKQFPIAPDGFKYCRNCGELKPLNKFSPVNIGINKDGKASWCNDCNLGKYYIKSELRGVKRRVTPPDGMNYCYRCNKTLPSTNAYFDKGHGRNGLQPMCKSCHKSYEQIYKTRPHAKRLNVLSTARRRMRKALLPFDYTDTDWQACLEYWGHQCAICGAKPDLWLFLAQDHWNPVNLGGGTLIDNIVPLCHSKSREANPLGSCNTSKRDTPPLEWLEQRFGKRKAKEIAKRVESYFEWVRQRKAA